MYPIRHLLRLLRKVELIKAEFGDKIKEWLQDLLPAA